MPRSNISKVRRAFDRDALARICAMDELDFGDAFDMPAFEVDQPAPDNFYYFRGHESNVLAVAHLDTVGAPDQRAAHFIDTEAGPVVYSRALDDRLGAYIILDLLPKLGLQYDILLTVGEESGLSTAAHFDPEDHEYDWMIEFDRGGTDVVMYQFEDDQTCAAVRDCGAVVGDGIFSDISYLDHLGIKGFNWGVGYRDYHGPRAHAYLDDTMGMVAKFLRFARQNDGVYMPHTPSQSAHTLDTPWWSEASDYDWDAYNSAVSPIDDPVFGYSEHPTLEDLQRYEEMLDREAEMAAARDDYREPV